MGCTIYLMYTLGASFRLVGSVFSLLIIIIFLHYAMCSLFSIHRQSCMPVNQCLAITASKFKPGDPKYFGVVGLNSRLKA